MSRLPAFCGIPYDEMNCGELAVAVWEQEFGEVLAAADCAIPRHSDYAMARLLLRIVKENRRRYRLSSTPPAAGIAWLFWRDHCGMHVGIYDANADDEENLLTTDRENGSYLMPFATLRPRRPLLFGVRK